MLCLFSEALEGNWYDNDNKPVVAFAPIGDFVRGAKGVPLL